MYTDVYFFAGLFGSPWTKLGSRSFKNLVDVSRAAKTHPVDPQPCGINQNWKVLVTGDGLCGLKLCIKCLVWDCSLTFQVFTYLHLLTCLCLLTFTLFYLFTYLLIYLFT